MRQLWTFLAILAAVAAATWYDFNPRFPLQLGLDLQGGMRVTFAADLDKAKEKNLEVTASTMDQVRQVLEKRVNGFGLTGAEVRKKGDNQIVVLLPGAKNPEEAMAKISTVAQLEFRLLRKVQSQANPAGIWKMEQSTVDGRDVVTFTNAETGEPVDTQEVLDASQLIITGSQLKPNSQAQVNPTNGSPLVTFELKKAGAKAFGDVTKKNVNEHLAIVLDGEIITAPNINEPITGGRGQISGGFANMGEARDLANLLNSGALPIPLKAVDEQIVGATLGQESVVRSIKAGILGLALVLIFMLVYYFLPGLLADIALLFYATLTFAIFKIGHVVMDLPGITGFILSVGMAVDANVLIFERTKEEMRSGKTVHSAIDAGFNRAFSAIFDSNVTTWLICGVLVWLGAPIIRGFAITLAIGVAVSMFTAITVTRTMLHMVVNFEWARSEKLFGLGVSYLRLIPGFDYLQQNLSVFGKRAVYLGFSALLVIVSFVFIGLTPTGRGLQFDIDFTGGSVIEATFREPITQQQVKEVLAKEHVQANAIRIGKRKLATTTVSFNTGELGADGDAGYRAALEKLSGFDAGSYKVETNEDGKTARISLTLGDSISRAAITTAIQGAGLTLADLQVKTEEKQDLPAVLITSREIEPATAQAIRKDLMQVAGGFYPTTYSSTSIGPTIAKEVTRNSAGAILVASLCIILYLAFRFSIGGFVNGLKFGVCAVIALIHDITFVTGLFAVMGMLAGWKINSLFVTAALTVMGYSVHDTIVVYDRLRENLRHRIRGETLAQIADKSITQTFDRSINTSVTIMVVCAALIFFGGETIRLFNVALLAGVAIGTYSSIFVASPLLVAWERMNASVRRREASSETATLRPATGGRRPQRPAEKKAPSPQAESRAASATAAADGRSASRKRKKKATVKPKRRRRRM